MKKFLLTLTLTISLSCFSQSIKVDSDKYNVSDLVNKVLINSECVSATNVVGITGTNFGSTNGIGYFENTNPNFPMKSGVILSTGKASNAVGPNTNELNDGSAAWTGDVDLENTLAAAGIGMKSANATILEFDFTPISTNFDFQFLFASEEYGNFQCQFSDAFAFLLTDNTTGITTNLAVVPQTNIPISVVTIRDYLYNSSCSSENSQYFGSYNGGSAAAKSATNFNGQTKLLKASATLSLNRTYHIKLVIADRSDYRSDTGADSAIFIASDSFNLGQDVLGDDLLLVDNTALCADEPYVIDSKLDPADYTLNWKKDGTPLPAETGKSSLLVKVAGKYELTYQKKINGCVPITDTVVIEYYAKATTPNAINLFKCNSGATSYIYDLSINTPIIKKGLDNATEVSYHISDSDANNNSNPLPDNYTSTGDETIYVRIKIPAISCYLVKTFKLQLTSPAVATKPADMNVCSNKTKAPVQLISQSDKILNGQNKSLYTVSYYASLADATTNTNILTGAYTTESTTIYARVQVLNDADCFAITDFKVNVQITPTLDPIPNVVVCDAYTLPALAAGNYFTETNGQGTALFAGDLIKQTQTIHVFNQPNGADGCSSNISFQVKILDPLQLVPKSGSYCGSYALPAMADMQYRTQTGGLGTIINPGTVIKASQKVHVYFKSTIDPFCEINADFDITIFPTVNVGTFKTVFDCTSYTLPQLTVGDYYTKADGLGDKINAGTVITATQVIYVYAITADGCISKGSFSVIIGVNKPVDVRQCKPYILPALAIGDYYTGEKGTGTKIKSGTAINLTQEIYIYVVTSNNPNCTDDIHFKVEIDQPIIDALPNVTACEEYTLPALNSGEYFTAKNGGGIKLEAGTIINKTQTIYIFKKSLTKVGCDNENSFKVNILTRPLIDSRSNIDICNFYILTDLKIGEYFTGPNGTGKKLSFGTRIETSQTVYIYATSSTTLGCSSEGSFSVTIFPMKADAPKDVTVCDSYTLPGLINGNYFSVSGGPKNGTKYLLHAGDVIKASTTLYVFAESGERVNCTDESSFKINIIASPKLATMPPVNVCNSYTLPALTLGKYYTKPNAQGTELKVGDVLTSSQVIYVYAETGTVPNCTDEKTLNINIFNVDEIKDSYMCDSYVLPVLKIGNYYTGTSGTGTKLIAGQTLSSTQKVYIYAKSPFTPTCSDESSFTITKVVSPKVNPISNSLLTACDEDGLNDGIFKFDLTQLSATALGSQTTSEYKVEYFDSQVDAVTGAKPILSTTSKTVFVRVSNTLAKDCFEIKSLNIIINKIPEAKAEDGIICYDSKTNTLIKAYTIQSGMSATNYTFQWFDDDKKLVGTKANYTAELPGIYTLVTTSNATGCSSEPMPIIVSPSEPATITYKITEDFADNSIVTVIAIGEGGNYEYKLGFGPFQDSPVFENLSSGIHKITVRDKNGCGVSSSEVLVIKYPKFFTPNSDGFNDTWNITDVKDKANVTINIFDRYGKLITNINPNGKGWDGSYSGKQLPSTDYWFTVNYTDDGVTKEFKSHFSMKR